MRISQKNNEIAVGVVVKEPVLSVTKNGKNVCKFSLGLGKDSDGENMYANVVCWGELALAAAQEIKPKDSVMVIGINKSREYNGKTYTDLNAEWVGQSVKRGNDDVCAAPEPKPQAQEHKLTNSGFEDDSLPF